ncbi:17774_t:CDS:2, partial [Gigaspora rosea]
MLNSTSDSPISKSQIKRQIIIRYQGGEGVAFLDEEIELRCSAGVFAFNQIGVRYLLTSGRCFPEDALLFYHVPWHHPDTSTLFGILHHISFSDDEFPSLFIENFGYPSNVGQHICISGYEILIACGRVSSLNARVDLPPLRRHVRIVSYRGVLKMEVFDVNIRDRDRGGTVFSYLPSTEYQRVEAYGIVTHSYERAYGAIYGGTPIVVTTIQRLRESVPARPGEVKLQILLNVEVLIITNSGCEVKDVFKGN